MLFQISSINVQGIFRRSLLTVANNSVENLPMKKRFFLTAVPAVVLTTTRSTDKQAKHAQHA